MSYFKGWLNTSKDKPKVWVKPTDDIMTESVFLNFASKAETDEIVEILRLAFHKGVSFTLMVDTENIRRSKTGSLGLETTLDAVLKGMVEEEVKAKPVDPATKAKANAIKAGLEARPTVDRTKVTATDDLDFESY